MRMPKMRIDLARVKTLRHYCAVGIGTSAGAGFFPWGPGTMGALVGMPIAFYSNSWPVELRLLLWIALTAAGVWAANVIDEIMGSADNQSIVMDETVGLGITAWTASQDLKTLWVAFVLFRFFDIVKPFPVRTIDNWSKKKAGSSRFWGGFGVMADDVVAGFQGLIVILILQHFKLLQ